MINDSKPHIWSLLISGQKLAQKNTHFTTQFCSKDLAHFTNLNSFNIVKNILPQHSQKPYFTYFPANMFLVSVRKKHLHCTISRRPSTVISKHLECKCLYIPINLCRNIFVPDMFGPCKIFFILIKIFWNLTIFQHCDTSINSIETLQFSRQFRLRG